MARSFVVLLAVATAAFSAVPASAAPRPGSDAPPVYVALDGSPPPAAVATAAPATSGDAIASARRSVAAGDLDGAIANLAAFVAARPGQTDAARYLGDLYYRKSDFPAAERTYLAILRVDPRDRETYNRLGGIYAAEDRIPDAIAAFTSSLPNTSAYGKLADLHRRFGDIEQYRVKLRVEADSRPDDSEAQYAIGVVDHVDRQFAEAATYLERSVLLQPLSCPALAELGSVYLDLNRSRDAVETLQRCLGYDRDDYAALVNLGVAYTQISDETRARAEFEHAHRVRPDGAEAIVDLGYLEDLDGRWQSAVQEYLNALMFDPLERDAYLDLGYDYNEHGLYALAEAAYLKGLSTSPDDGRLHYLLGETYAGQGKRNLARAEYQRAEQSDEPEVVRAAAHDLANIGN